MKKKLKKTLQKALDSILQENLEKTYYRLMNEDLLNLISSTEDFLLGIIVGDLLEGLGFCTYGIYKRHPTDEEIKSLYHIVQERSDEIRDKIKLILK